MTLKVQDDASGKYSKSLANKNHPLEIGFKLNEFGNNPNGSLPKESGEQVTNSSPSPYSLSQSSEAQTVYNDEKKL